jgi:diguanylate cyclase (GGDEF)-like protein/PAS domain S-box-containing protein
MEVLTSLRLRIVLSFVVAAAILGTAAFTLYNASQRNQKTRNSIFQTRSEIIALQSLLTTVQDAETGQRGFLLTDDESYLEPYNRATAEVAGELSNLEGFSAHDPHLQVNLPGLRKHVGGKMSELAETIGLRRTNESSKARNLVLAGVGQREMKAIRSLISELLAEQNKSLDELRQNYETSLTKNNHLLVSGIGVQFVLLVLVFFFFYRDAANRLRSSREMQKAHARLDAILSTMGDGVYQVDLSGKLLYLNPAGERMLGYSRREIEGLGMHDLIHAHTPSGEYRSASNCPLSEVMRSGAAYATPPGQDDWFKKKDGSFITVELAGTPLKMGDEIVGVVVSFRDISERRHHEEQLRAMTELQQAILRSATVAIISCHADGVISTFNPAAERMLQYKAEEVVEKVTPELIHDPEEVARRASDLSQELGIPVKPGMETFTVKAGKFNQSDHAEWTYIRKDGSRFPVSLTITALRDAEGRANGFIGLAEDITDRRMAEAAIRESQALLSEALAREKDDARLDFLTRIANRRAFYEIAFTESARARRYGRSLTLIYLDLDNFKQVNDTYGHEVGDELLIEVAATIRSNVRTTDTVARLGGDEFALLLPETDQDAALLVTNKLREVLLNSMQRKNWPVTVSIGLVTFSTPPESVEEMVKQADAVMYSVKARGKNSIATA